MRRVQPRRGLSALEVVLVTAVTLTMVSILYWMFAQSLDQFFFALGNAVNWPFLSLTGIVLGIVVGLGLLGGQGP